MTHTIIKTLSDVGLTQEMIDARRKGIGGSDAGKIMDGSWHDLWEIKTGRSEGDDLSDIFHVQLGHITEWFNLEWLKKEHPVDLMQRPTNIVRSDKHEFMQCIPDALGIWEGKQCVIDAKHTNQWSDADSMYKRYYWQLTHNAYVTESEVCIISPIYGNQFGPPIVWEVDPMHTTKLIEAERSFWWHVQNDVEPEDDSRGSSVPLPSLDDMIEIDMEGNNEWASLAVDFKENKEQHDKHAKAKKGLRSLVEDNMKLARGHGVTAKRGNDKRVRISIDKKR